MTDLIFMTAAGIFLGAVVAGAVTTPLTTFAVVGLILKALQLERTKDDR